MRFTLLTLGFVALSSLVVGCVDRPRDEAPELEDEEAATVGVAQLDPGMTNARSFTIKQSGVTVASSWAGNMASGAPVEYWVSKPTYSASAARTFDGTDQSCSAWKASVCTNKAWKNATIHHAIYTQQTLSCALPPGPCSPPAGTVSFLGAGSWQVTDNAGTPFAWTYVSGACEYWSMSHTISAGHSTQAPFSPAFLDRSDFFREMCSKSPVPSTYFEATYEELGDCSDIQC